MSQGILTNAGRDLFAAKQGAGQPLVIDRFLLANISGLDPLTAADPDEALPVVGDRVAELAVTNSGYVNADKVVYSLYLGTLDGDYTFNWVGLLADDDTLVAVRYIDPVNKYATVGQSLGNAITRNFLVTYTDAQAITNITVDAATWQLNFDNASETVAGLAKIATQAKTDAGLDDLAFLTPKKHANFPHTAAATSFSNTTVPLAATDTQAAIEELALRSRRNLIINGNFDIWQRGTSFTPLVGTQYTADRFFAYSAGAAAATVGQAAGTGTPFEFALACTGAALNTQISYGQRIESHNARSLRGKTVTVRMWHYSSDSRAISYGLNAANTKDDFSAVTNMATGSFTAATGWREEILTVALPDNALIENGLSVEIGFGATLAGVTVSSTGWSLEEGSLATDFEYRPIAEELALCQRYYEVIEPSMYVMDPHGSNSGVLVGALRFTVPKRANPTVGTFTVMHANGGTTYPGRYVVAPKASGMNGLDYVTANQFTMHWTYINTTDITVDAEL